MQQVFDLLIVDLQEHDAHQTVPILLLSFNSLKQLPATSLLFYTSCTQSQTCMHFLVFLLKSDSPVPWATVCGVPQIAGGGESTQHCLQQQLSLFWDLTTTSLFSVPTSLLTRAVLDFPVIFPTTKSLVTTKQCFICLAHARHSITMQAELT